MHHTVPFPPKEETTKPYRLLSAITWFSGVVQSTQVSFVLIGSSKHLGHVRFRKHSKIGEAEISPSVSSPKSWNTGYMIELFPSPGRSNELGFFSSLFHAKLGRATTSMYVLIQTFAFVFSDPQFALSCQHLDLGKIKIRPSSSPLKIL